MTILTVTTFNVSMLYLLNDKLPVAVLSCLRSGTRRKLELGLIDFSCFQKMNKKTIIKNFKNFFPYYLNAFFATLKGLLCDISLDPL